MAATKSHLSLSEVNEKLAKGELHMRSPKKSRKSEHWKRFKEINHKDGQFANHIQCKNCRKVFFYNNLNGTNSLRRHKCSVPTSQRSLDTFLTKKPADISSKQRLDILDATVAMDDFPIELFDDEDFHQFVDKLFEIQFNHTELLTSKDTLPSLEAIEANGVSTWTELAELMSTTHHGH